MAKISSYAVIAAPSLSDLLIGTDVDDSNITKNFSLTSALTLFNAGAVPTATSTRRSRTISSRCILSICLLCN